MQAFMYVFDEDSGQWVPFTGSGGGVGTDVNVTGGTLDSVGIIGQITNPVQVEITSPAQLDIDHINTLGQIQQTVPTSPQTPTKIDLLTNAAFTQWRCLVGANMGGLASDPLQGAAVVAHQGQWVAWSDPGAATLATVTKAAVAAKYHVIQAITGSVLAVNSQAGLTLRLTDGATDIWSTKFLPPSTQGRDFSLSGLNIRCSLNTAVTLAFNAAPAAGNFCTCAMFGYTVG